MQTEKNEVQIEKCKLKNVKRKVYKACTEQPARYIETGLAGGSECVHKEKYLFS